MNTEVQFTAPGVAELVHSDLPVCGPDRLLVRAIASLISPGTERAFLLGLENTARSYPMGAGYSMVAEVVEVGAEVSGWAEGDRLATPIQHQRIAAVRPADCTPVPDNLASEQACFFFMAAIALQGVRKAGVATLGAGIIGLLAMQWAKLNGAVPALMLDVDDTRLELARELGADAALQMQGDYLDRIAALCDGGKPQVVVDATGHPAAVTSAFDVIGHHGRLVLLGSTRGNTPDVNFYRDVHKTGLTLIGAHNSVRPAADSSPGYWTMADDQRLVLRCLAAGRLRVAGLATHRFAWEDAPAAYAELAAWNPETLGLILNWAD
ncbi:MAG: zinc-binding dehydrogenase [Caldilineaceae bacterium]|nr:zinc-binding dehydrogenase [Caldilineaceae bacterium]